VRRAVDDQPLGVGGLALVEVEINHHLGNRAGDLEQGFVGGHVHLEGGWDRGAEAPRPVGQSHCSS
jgi:hypothetical protein